VSLQDVATFCQEGKLAHETLKKVSPTKVDAHSPVPLQEPAPNEVLGQAPPGLGGRLGQNDGHVNDDPSEEHDASLPHLVNDNEEEGDDPSTDWNMDDHLTPNQKSKQQGLLDENRNAFAITMATTTIRGDKCAITPDDTLTLEVLRPATLGLGGGLDPVEYKTSTSR
jgi:hypothetical protein